MYQAAALLLSLGCSLSRQGGIALFNVLIAIGQQYPAGISVTRRVGRLTHKAMRRDYAWEDYRRLGSIAISYYHQ